MVRLPVLPEPLVGQVAMTARLARDLPRYFRRLLSVDAARAQVRRRLANRDALCWTMVERLIYARPASPYARLLRHAGCELGDFRALVAAHGIEGALRQLADRGVYVTFDELKGRREIVRGSFHLQRDGGIDQYVADVWQRAGTLVVRRERPQATRTGKVLPFQLGKYAGTTVRPS